MQGLGTLPGWCLRAPILYAFFNSASVQVGDTYAMMSYCWLLRGHGYSPQGYRKALCLSPSCRFKVEEKRLWDFKSTRNFLCGSCSRVFLKSPGTGSGGGNLCGVWISILSAQI